MLINAEGAIHRAVVGDQLEAVRAWLGPTVDSGFMQSGYVDLAGERLWLVLTTDAEQRLGDLPVVQDGSVSFTTVAASAQALSRSPASKASTGPRARRPYAFRGRLVRRPGEHRPGEGVGIPPGQVDRG